jgi:hypothetical protein
VPKHPLNSVAIRILEAMISQAEAAIERNRHRLARAETRPPLAKQLRVSNRIMELRLAELRLELDSHQEALLRSEAATVAFVTSPGLV